MAAHPAYRETIFLEDAEVLGHETHEGNQFILKLKAPKCSRSAVAGAFVHLQCDPLLQMRRPLSIMRVNAERQSIEVLYKIVGPGLQLLSQKKIGDRISVLGPIGKGFEPHPSRPRTVLVGGGVGIPPMIFLAEQLREQVDVQWKPLVLMGSEVPFPFRARPSTILVPGIPEGTIASMPLLEEWSVPSRLATLQGYPGCYDGYVTDLAAKWLESLDQDTLDEVEMFACGPTVMLKAAALVAKRFKIPCQVSLEEFMACAVGGCAGCAVRVETKDGPAMKRVCVDGPVFDAYSVFPG